MDSFKAHFKNCRKVTIFGGDKESDYFQNQN